MISSARALVSAAILTVALPALAATTHKKPAVTQHKTTHTTTHHTTTSHPTKRGAHTSHTSKSHKSKPVLTHIAMTTERATEIQTALIKQGYLTGEPTGKWDAASIAAMQKLQSDNGWQTKIMPDSRAIIKLGLGPNSQGPSE
ncbi:MAG: peptidoglycan-binding domain-containing protein [Acidobacteriota bacterium]